MSDGGSTASTGIAGSTGSPGSTGTKPARQQAKGRSRADTRDILVESAIATLQTRGMTGTSARTIAAAAGVNQALIFYHFGGMDDLLAEACRRSTERRVAHYRERFAGVT